jgi:ankyrin repeat protein
LKSEDQVRNMSIRKSETSSWECRVLVSAGDEKVLEKHLVERNIDPNVRFRNETLIATAIKLRLPNIVKVLLRYGANPNLRSFENGRNEPPLITATRWKSIEIVKLLIKSGANLHATEFYG